MTDLPVPKDPVTTAIEKSIDEAAETARHYLDKLVSPGLEETGGLIKDTVSYWRFKNRVKLILKAKQFLDEKGIEPRRVPPKLLIPVLDDGSLEDDDDMRDRWAALLANAAASDQVESVNTVYPRILSELSPVDARVLDFIYRIDDNDDEYELNPTYVSDALKIRPERLRLVIDNLVRLNLCARPLGILPRIAPGDVDTGKYEGPLYLTTLGVNFVECCQRP